MKKWFQLGLFNLLILALLGLLLRYKIIFSLPFLNYTNLLHAHSHFAFNGWISLMLQLFILKDFTNSYNTKRTFWNGFFLVSTIVNYAMIVSFAATGYGAVSIAISTIGLFLSYIFCYKIYMTIPPAIGDYISTAFAKAAIFFLVLSSAGPYLLGISIAAKASGIIQHNALYFFLYFQYAGWFTFAILSLLFKKLESCNSYNKNTPAIVFNLFLFSCIPAYLFVCAFQNRSPAITGVLIGTSVLQAIAMYLLLRLLLVNKRDFFSNSNSIVKGLFLVAIASLTLKFILQFFSIHPALAQISLTNRPVTIAYLHLIFLCFVSIYLLAILIEERIIATDTRTGFTGAVSFVAGVIINEVLLALQGTFSLFNLYPHTLPAVLFANTVVIASGALLVFIASLNPITFINYSLNINARLLKITSWKL